MRRRRSEIPSSLELLLDTMCNTFGGIVFMAILLAVLLPRTLVTTQADPRTQEARIEIQRNDLESENQALRAKLNELGKLSDTYARKLKAREADPRSREQSELAKTLATITAITAQRDRLAAELQEQGTLAAAQAQQTVNVRRAVAELEAQVAALKTRMDAATRIEQRQFRLPQMRPTSKTPLFLVVKRGKLFQVTKAGGGSPPSDFDGRFVEWRSDGTNAWRFEVKSAAGLDLSNARTCFRNLEPFSSQELRREYYLEFWVYNDSFPEFIRLKEQVCRRGISYNWSPQEEGDPIGLRIVDTPVKHEVQ
jgi:hypothetical protein